MRYKYLLTASMAVFLSSNASAQDADVLTGDTRLACEAILCLSSGTRPNECAPSLDRYFGIKHKKWKDTVSARKDFLNLCPASNEQGMQGRINSIVQGAGRCDASYLNAHNTYTYEEKVCRYLPGHSHREDNLTCKTIEHTVISNTLPRYCGTYANHEWSYQLDVKYVGEPKNGGKWVDARDYDRALQEYNDNKKRRRK